MLLKVLTDCGHEKTRAGQTGRVRGLRASHGYQASSLGSRGIDARNNYRTQVISMPTLARGCLRAHYRCGLSWSFSPKQKTVLALMVPFGAGCWLIRLNFWPPGRARAAPKSSRGRHRFLAGRIPRSGMRRSTRSAGRAHSDWSSTGRFRITLIRENSELAGAFEMLRQSISII